MAVVLDGHDAALVGAQHAARALLRRAAIVRSTTAARVRLALLPLDVARRLVRAAAAGVTGVRQR